MMTAARSTSSAEDHLRPLWERACSRMRSIIQHFYRLTRRLREQARSHRGFAMLLKVEQCPRQ
ncbi:hypothetical protein E3Z29_18940 [Pseudomonas sp. S150]|nr:hypothetical protein E3Z29_18940 [Pseudomonas sp. S150]